jgi:hypothetical protein
MDVTNVSNALFVSKHLGFPDEVIRDIAILLEHVAFSAMSAEEQAVFMLELGRLAADRYTQVASKRQDSVTMPPFSLIVREICQVLCNREA